MRVCFWGTRGSIATPGPDTIRFGGNTSCVEVRTDAGALIVLDCGTGARILGRSLMSSHADKLRGHILISHTHWDHIQGLPFFAPLFSQQNTWDIYAPRGLAHRLRETLAGQMEYIHFPVSLEQLGAEIRYHDLVEGSFIIDETRVRTHYLNHPALTLGYRLSAHGATIVYATDHEPHTRALGFGERPKGREIGREDARHAEFMADADLLIHDAQYTAEEYAGKIGWGHSTVEYVVDMALLARVKRLALFHHDPLRTDAAVDRLVDGARERVLRAGATLEVFAAAEGRSVQIDENEPTESAASHEDFPDAVGGFPAVLRQSILVAVADTAASAVITSALRADGLDMLLADGTGKALELARAHRPALVLIERRLGGRDALEFCRALHRDPNPALRTIPVVIVTDEDDPAENAACDKAGVTDRLLMPFSIAYARTRVRAWLFRTESHWTRPSIPADEAERLKDLDDLHLMGTPPEERFDRIVRVAQRLFDVEVAYLSLIGADQQWVKSTNPYNWSAIPRDASVCAHTILGDRPMVISDGLNDSRFGDHPVFTELAIRSYAGMPLKGRSGYNVGALCLLDRRPRQYNNEELGLLKDLATWAEYELHRDGQNTSRAATDMA